VVARTAREWVGGVRDGSGVDWAALQAVAFSQYPTVRRRVDPSGDYVPASVPHKRLRQIGTGALVIVFIVAGLSPIMGVIAAACAHGGRGRYSRLSTPPAPGLWIPIAAVSFAVTIAVIAVVTITWWRGGRTKGSGARAYTALCAVLAIISVPVAAVPAADAHMAGWQGWVAVIAVAAVLGVLSLIMQLAASRPAPDQDGVKRTGRSIRAQRAIARLTPQQRAAVRRDIDSAISELVRRGLVSEDGAQRARAAELGCLPERMTERTPEDATSAPSADTPSPRSPG
jgi:hypothetical protein